MQDNLSSQNMRKSVFAIFLISALTIQAQQKSSLETRALLQAYNNSKSAALPELLTSQLAITTDAQGTTVRALAKVTPSFDKAAMQQRGITVTSQVANIVSLRLPIDALKDLEACPDILQYTVAHKSVPHCDKSRNDTHVDSVQQGLGGLPQGINGEGVLVGITDWGFDYGHPNYNSSAERRIFRAWDQVKLSGPAPAGFDYGTEYTTYEQLLSAGSDTSNIYGYNSHGSHVAGIIGGRGKKTGTNQYQYIGMAPKVQYLLGTWLLNEASWIDQVSWMHSVAKEVNKRLVINSSWGMYSFSDLDGTSLLSQAINHYSDSGIVFVTSAGNNGDDAFHIQHHFGDNDTLRTKANYYVAGAGQILVFWGTPDGGPFQVSFALQGSDQVMHTVPYYATDSNINLYQSEVIIGNDTIPYSIMTEQRSTQGHRPHAVLKVRKHPRTNYTLHVFCTATSGSDVHAWNVNFDEGHESNVGSDFVGGEPGYTPGDHNYGIGEPACADKTIAVAAHSSGTWIHDTVYREGAIAYFSSYGPTLDGRNKPEISAPGVGVISSVSSYDTTHYTVSATISANGRTYKFAGLSGTSMSSPAVSGIVALMLQVNPQLSVDQVRDIIFSTALNDGQTGRLIANDSVSRRWGHGKIDAMKAVAAAIDRLDIEEAVRLNVPLAIYPNPATTHITIETGSNRPTPVTVYNIDGRIVTQLQVSTTATVNTSFWNKGIYIIKAQDRTGVRTAKLILR